MVRTKSWQCDLQNLRVWTKCIWCEQKFQECDKYLNGVNKIMTVWSKKKMVWTKNLMVWTKISMVWTKCIRCDETIWWCDQKFWRCDRHHIRCDQNLTVWSKIWRCDQNLDGVIKTFLVWSNVHLLEIVWSHRVVWSFHMFFSDGKHGQRCAVASESDKTHRHESKYRHHRHSQLRCAWWQRKSLAVCVDETKCV